MEPAEKKMRLIVNLGKYQIVNVIKGTWGVKFTIQLPNNVKLIADLPVPADIRVGDIQTLYTEVLADAIPSGTPVQ